MNPANGPPRSKLRIVLFLLGVVLTLVLVWRVGPGAIASQLEHVGPEALWLLVPYAIGTSIAAFPWRWLLPPGTRPSTSGTVLSRFAASGANAMLPFFGLAGEPARLLWLRADAQAAGLAAMVIDRVLYNSGSALFLLSGAVAARLATSMPPVFGTAAFLTGSSILVVTLGLGAAAARFGVGRPLQALLRRLLGGRYARKDFGGHVDTALVALLASRREKLWLGLAVHFLGRLVNGFEAYLALHVLNVPVDLGRALVIASVPVATSLVASSIPSQLGVQEASQELVCRLLGLPPGAGLALVLLQRARQVVFVAMTPLLLGASRAR